MTVIGIDLGGTKISAVLLDPDTRQIAARKTIPTEGKLGPDAVVARIADVCRAVTADVGIALDDVRGIGVGMPCVIDYVNGRTLIMANLPGDWHEKPVAADLRAHGVPPERIRLAVFELGIPFLGALVLTRPRIKVYFAEAAAASDGAEEEP
mgnify:CR=1 FL=1